MATHNFGSLLAEYNLLLQIKEKCVCGGGAGAGRGAWILGIDK
jgi:hypothetical protein